MIENINKFVDLAHSMELCKVIYVYGAKSPLMTSFSNQLVLPLYNIV